MFGGFRYRGRGSAPRIGRYGGTFRVKETPTQYRLRKTRQQQEFLQRQAAREQRRAEREKIFAFNNTVMRWKAYQDGLYCPEETGNLAVLPSVYTGRQNYFASFKPLIMEESREIVKKNLAQYTNEKQLRSMACDIRPAPFTASMTFMIMLFIAPTSMIFELLFRFSII